MRRNPTHADPTPTTASSPDLERMVQQRKLGYLDQQTLLRSLNQQRMLQGQRPAGSIEEAVGGAPLPVRQTEAPPLQVDPRQFQGRGISVQSGEGGESPLSSIMASLGGAFQQLNQRQQQPPRQEAPPSAPQGQPQQPGAGVPHLQPGQQQQIPRTGVTDGASMKGVDARFAQAFQEYSKIHSANSPYDVRFNSGVGNRPGKGSQHPIGNAIDMSLYDREGKQLLGNYQTRDQKTFDAYQDFSHGFKQYLDAKYPDLGKDYRWGGYFHNNFGYGSQDLMHHDLGGRSGQQMRGGSFQRGLTPEMAQHYGLRPGGADRPRPQAGGAVPSAPEQPAAAPTAPTPAGTPQTGGTRATWFHTGEPYQAAGGKIWSDPGGRREGAPASGLGHNVPGIATPGRQGLGQWFEVTAPDGRKIVVQKTDIGPGTAATARGVGLDVNAAAASQLYPEGSHAFPSNSQGWQVKHVGPQLPQGVKPGLQSGGAAPVPPPQQAQQLQPRAPVPYSNSPDMPRVGVQPQAPAAPAEAPVATGPAESIQLPPVQVTTPRPAGPAPAPTAPPVAPRAPVAPAVAPPPNRTGVIKIPGVGAVEMYGGDLARANALVAKHSPMPAMMTPNFVEAPGGPRPAGAYIELPPEAGGGHLMMPGASKAQLYQFHTQGSKYLPGIKLKNFEDAPNASQQAPGKRGALDDPRQAYAQAPPQRAPVDPEVARVLAREQQLQTQRVADTPVTEEDVTQTLQSEYGDQHGGGRHALRMQPPEPPPPWLVPPLDQGETPPSADFYARDRQYGGGRHRLFGGDPTAQAPDPSLAPRVEEQVAYRSPPPPQQLPEGFAKSLLAATQGPDMPPPTPTPPPTPPPQNFAPPQGSPAGQGLGNALSSVVSPMQLPPPQPVQTTWEPPMQQAGMGMGMSQMPWNNMMSQWNMPAFSWNMPSFDEPVSGGLGTAMGEGFFGFGGGE